MRKFHFLYPAIAIFLFAGCPDYSHLRPVPDYTKMTDSGVESREPEKSPSETEVTK